MIKTITRDELVRLRSTDMRVRIVDVLSKESYAQEHVQGAISIPLDEVEQRAPVALKKNEKIVVYCGSFDCQASTRAAEKLERLGYNNVLLYKGGLKDYKEGNLPLEGALHAREQKTTCATC